MSANLSINCRKKSHLNVHDEPWERTMEISEYEFKVDVIKIQTCEW